LTKANTLQQIIDKIAELKTTAFKDSNDFKSSAIVKKHIRYRQTHNRIVFAVNKKREIRMIDIDYNAETAQEKLTY
jgi:hypothetical protein